jgi:hypothetical protein
MITGVVNLNGEAIIRIVVGDLEKQSVVVDALIDISGGMLTMKALSD